MCVSAAGPSAQLVQKVAHSSQLWDRPDVGIKRPFLSNFGAVEAIKEQMQERLSLGCRRIHDLFNLKDVKVGCWLKCVGCS